ncbi:fibronectin type III domain-containing protein [Aliihoeflea sp. 40Bstr573]|nr:fibronectin type III domain-containing protein [Aliihoeflea sp. 40Bstr573]MCO6386345.1 fibronectin type III domain-containing protein [Aliihoeflea sp. 40Bstr573]
MARTGFIEGAILLAFTSAGVTGSALAIGTTLLAGAVSIGLSTGLSFLAQSLFRPSAPKPEDVQQSVRQATAPRMRHYGRVKASGPWVFAESKGGAFYKVLALGQGPIDAIEEYWIDDEAVTLDGAGEVTNGKAAGAAAIESRLGQSTEAAYTRILSNFPEWTADHSGNGVASLQIFQAPTPDSEFLSIFPNGINTNYRVVLRGSRVVNPVTSVTEWSDNAAAVIRDYLTHPDGMRLPASIISTPLAAYGWEVAYYRSIEAIPLAAGGDEPRYRLWGSYQLNERPADVLGRMLQACDGRLVPTPDGGLTLDIGNWAEPTVTIGPETITGFSELGRRRDVLTTANTIRATYLEPNQDYQAAEADPWADEVDVSERGEIASDVQFNMAPSHSQARRLMKLAAFRANPNWVGTFQCNLRALAAIDQRFVRIQYPLFGINSVFEVQDLRFNIGEGGLLTGVTLQVQSMPSAAYDWDTSQEGTAPVYNESEGSDGVPVPGAPTVDFVGGAADLTFSPSPSILLFYQVRYKTTSGTEWTTSGNLANDATSFTTGTLTADTEYEFQLRFITEKGRTGDWSTGTVATTPA